MELTLIGHDDRYAVEQLQMALFPEDTQGQATSGFIPATVPPPPCGTRRNITPT